MGIKNKWRNNAPERLNNYLQEVEEILLPYFKTDGIIDLSTVNQRSDLAYLMALIINCKFILSEDKRDWSFGADDIIPLRLEIINNEKLIYWGKIFWISKPKDHQCFKSFQDPFYGELGLNEEGIKIEQMMFGDYEQMDLEGTLWVGGKVDWMYDV